MEGSGLKSAKAFNKHLKTARWTPFACKVDTKIIERDNLWLAFQIITLGSMAALCLQTGSH